TTETGGVVVAGDAADLVASWPKPNNGRSRTAADATTPLPTTRVAEAARAMAVVRLKRTVSAPSRATCHVSTREAPNPEGIDAGFCEAFAMPSSGSQHGAGPLRAWRRREGDRR